MLSVVIAAPDPDVLPALRKLLLAVVRFVMAGTILDLLLLGHYEEAWQWLPLIVIAAALGVAAWAARANNAPAVHLFGLTLSLFVELEIISAPT